MTLFRQIYKIPYLHFHTFAASQKIIAFMAVHIMHKIAYGKCIEKTLYRTTKIN